MYFHMMRQRKKNLGGAAAVEIATKRS